MLGLKAFAGGVLIAFVVGTAAAAQDDGFGGDGNEVGRLPAPIDISFEISELRLPHAEIEKRQAIERQSLQAPQTAVIGLSPEESALREKLRSVTDFDFSGGSLRELALWLRLKLDVDVRLDQLAIEEEDMSLGDEIFSLQAKQMRFDTGLDLMLRQQGLGHLAEGNVLVISSQTKCEVALATCIFPVWDLVKSPISNDLDQADFRSLVELLATIVVPNSWDTVGGPGTIKVFDGNLVVSNTRDVLEEVESLLGAVRKFPLLDRSANRKFMSLDPSVGDAEAEVRKRLSKTMAFDFEGVTIEEFARQLSETSGVPHLFDTRSLEDEGVDPTSDELTIRLRKASHANGMRLAFQDHQLAHIIDRDVVLITSKVSSEERLKTRLFDIAGMLDRVEWLTCTPHQKDVARIVDTLITTVEPDSWDKVGGPGSIATLPKRGMLVISNTGEVLDAIERSLTMMETARAASDAPSVKAISPGDISVKSYVLSSRFEKEEERGQVLLFLEKTLAGSDNAVNETCKEFFVSQVRDKLIVSHRNDAQRLIGSLLTKLDFVEPTLEVPAGIMGGMGTMGGGMMSGGMMGNGMGGGMGGGMF